MMGPPLSQGIPPTLTATPGDRQVTLGWEASSLGASVITHYEYQYRMTSVPFDENTWTRVSGDGSARQVTISGLTGGTNYFFRVRAVNAQGAGVPSTEIDATPYDESAPEPGAPGNLRAIPGDRQVTLKWEAPSWIGDSEITSYEYQYSTTSGAFDNTWTDVPNWASALEITISSLTGATRYFFRVRAVNEQGKGYSTQVSVTPYDGATAEPGAPTNLMATSGDRQVTLGWEASSLGASVITSYEYQYKTTSGTFDENTWTEVPNWESALEITIPNLIGATTYAFRVRAVNTQGPGAPSTEVEAIAYDGPTPEPGVPPNLTPTSGDRQVTLNWEASSLGASEILRYEYQYSTTRGTFDENTWTEVPNWESALEITIPNLTEATTYYFRVRAVNAQGTGAPSTEMEAIAYDGPTPEPGKPKNLIAIFGDRQVRLSWEASSMGASAITRYEYQYGTTGTFSQTWTEVPDWESALEVTIDGLIGGTTYHFQVRAVNAQGEGIPSDASQTPYDRLTNPEAVCSDPATTGDALPGMGTVDDPFVLCSPVHLNLIGGTNTDYTLSASYVMGQDIDLNSESFTPIAGVFTGTLDGRDKKIMNLTINVSGHGALFVELGVGGNIKNLGIENFDVTGSGQVGSLVATSSGTITNCYAVDSDDSTDVSGGVNSDSVGGLVGKLSSGSITSSYATGDPSGGESIDHTGGLVGRQNGGSIISSYATGNPEGGTHNNAFINIDTTGGLVGYQFGGSIISSYATGNPEGGSRSDQIGGLVGGQGHSGSIISSYATGSPNGRKDQDQVGGLVGQSSGSITSSYATGDPNGGESKDHVGGLVGKQFGGSIISSYATGNPEGGTRNDDIGGLVGIQYGGSIISSYATGDPNGGKHNDNVGGLVGYQLSASITSSYATGNPDGGVRIMTLLVA